MNPAERNYLHVGLELLRSTGGTTKAVSDFARALPGSSVAALCSSEKLRDQGPFSKSWRYLPLEDSLRGRLYSVPERSSLTVFQTGGPRLDGVFCHMLYRSNTNLTARLAVANAAPYYVVPHGSLDPWVFTYRAWQKILWLRLFGRKFLRDARAVIFATEGERRKAMREVPLTNSLVINWPVESHTDLTGETDSVRRQFKLPLARRLLLSFGRLHSMKRPLELIELFRRSECRTASLVMVGPDDDVTHAQCLAAARGDVRIHCLGPVYGQQLTNLIGACDGYISWSRRENFNYCLAESMAAGRPVIAGPGNDLAVDLRGQNCGWFPLSDFPENMLAAIYDFAAITPEELNQLGSNARRIAEDRFSPVAFSRTLQSLVNAS
jgi:glycosyltransferase involved in cell wall biosynthesis